MTSADHAEVIPADFTQTVRGYVAELDGKIVGVMGVLHSTPPLAFGKMWPELRKHPRTVLQAIEKFRDMLIKHYTYVIADADITETNSPAVLTRVGFVQIREATEDSRGVFLWRL